MAFGNHSTDDRDEPGRLERLTAMEWLSRVSAPGTEFAMRFPNLSYRFNEAIGDIQSHFGVKYYSWYAGVKGAVLLSKDWGLPTAVRNGVGRMKQGIFENRVVRRVAETAVATSVLGFAARASGQIVTHPMVAPVVEYTRQFAERLSNYVR
jgi:hypothetical protein